MTFRQHLPAANCPIAGYCCILHHYLDPIPAPYTCYSLLRDDLLNPKRGRSDIGDDGLVPARR